MAFKNGDLER